MTARILAFANQKGGVGKTTICLQAAFYFSQKKKQRVLVIDGDGQGSITNSLLGDVESWDGMFRTSDLFTDPCPSVQATPTRWKNLDLIPANGEDNSMYEVENLSLEHAALPAQNITPLLEKYDWIFIDCPPSLGTILTAWLALADYVACPVRLSGFAVKGLEHLYNTITTIKQVNTGLKTVGVIVNEFNATGAQKAALAAIEEILGSEIFTTKLKSRSPIDMASLGEPIWNIRNSKAATEEFKALFTELQRRIAAADKAQKI